MASIRKLVEAARSHRKAVRFADLVKIVEGVGYTHARTTGSHQIYTAPALPMINLQRTRGSHAKPYQVTQVLELIDTHKLEVK